MSDLVLQISFWISKEFNAIFEIHLCGFMCVYFVTSDCDKVCIKLSKHAFYPSDRHLDCFQLLIPTNAAHWMPFSPGG